MASIQLKNESYYCQFRYLGKRHTVTVGKVSSEEAEAFAGKVEYLLLRIRQRLIHVPPGVSIAEFVLADGRVEASVVKTVEPTTLRQLVERYLETHQNGTLETNSLSTVATHLKHVERTLSGRFRLCDLSLADLQRHVDRRARCKGLHKRPLSPATLRKEVASFRAVWNWGGLMDLVEGPFPNKGLRFPKADEKPPFQTRAEIERQLALGGLTEAQVRGLWDSLYLVQPEIAEFLAHVRQNAAQPFLYPMACTAAHTGARRSELLRCKVADVDLAAGTIVLSEKKRSKDRRTSRRVPVSAFLAGVLTDWLANHPGGPQLFCQAVAVVRSKTHRTAPTPITRDEAHDHFQRTLAGGKWAVLRGWHVLRHSFVSACASRGVDQRLIDEWVGHTTEDMRRRYRHLYPSSQRAALNSVFGG